MNKFFKTIFCLTATLLLATSAQAATAYLKAQVASNSSGMGKVYAGNSNSAGTYNANSSQVTLTRNSNGNVTGYLFAQANTGYEFLGWSTVENNDTYNSSASPYSVQVRATGQGATYTYYAMFRSTPRYVEYWAYVSGTGGKVAVNTSNTMPADSEFGTAVNLMNGAIPDSGKHVYTSVFARPDEGYLFSHWSLEPDSTQWETGDNPTMNPIRVGTTVTDSNTSQATAKSDKVYAHFVKAVAYVVSNGQFYKDFLSAYNDAQDGDTIKLLQNVDDAYNLTLSKNMTYTSYYPDQKCGFTRTAAAATLNIAAGKTLTLDNFYFDGNNVTGNDSFLVVPEGATLVLNDGAEIRNCVTAGNGAGIRSSGTVTMNGGSITNCRTTGGKGGAIYAEGGTVNAAGGTISNCSASQGGGAVYLEEGATSYATYYRWTLRQSNNSTYLALSEFALLDANGNRINQNSSGYTYDGNFTTEAQSATAIANLQPGHVIITGGSIGFYGNNNTTKDVGALFDGYADSSHNRVTINSPSFNNTTANYRSIVFRVPDGSNPAVKYYYNIGNQAANSPTSWTLERSYDGETWTTIDTKSGISALSTGYAKSTEYTISNTDAGVTAPSAVLNVSGAPQITGNTSGSVANNVQPAGNDQVKLAGAFTGAVGVKWPSSGEPDDVQFGVVTSGSDANGFVYDGDDDFHGVVDNGTLVWQVTDPVCRVVSTGKVYGTLAKGYAAAAATDEIQILKNLTLDNGSMVSVGKNITLSSDPGHTYTLTRGGTGCAVAVPDGKTITLSNIVIDGNNLNGTTAMFQVEDGGTLTVNSDATIQNCRNVSGNGGAVNAEGGATVNFAGTISNCSAAKGGAVYLAGGISTPSSYYTYYRYTFKKAYNSTQLMLGELSLYDASNNRVNGGGYTAVNKSAADLGPGEVTMSGNTTLNANDTGADKLFDGNLHSRLFFDKGTAFNNAANESSWATVTFRLKDGSAQPVSYTFTAYDQNYNSSIPARNPDVWTVEGSVDGVNWTQIDSQSGKGATPASTSAETTKYAVNTTVPAVVGTAATMNLTGGTITGCSAAEGGAVYVAGGSAGAGSSGAGAPVEEVHYTYYKFTLKKCYGQDNWNTYLIQLSELSLYDSSNNRVNQGVYSVVSKDPSELAAGEVTVTGNNGYSGAEGPTNLFDGDTGTKLCLNGGFNNEGSSTTWASIVFRLPEGTAAPASYSFTTANDCTPARNPASWTVEGSTDGVNWTELDSKSGQGATPTATTTEGTKFPINTVVTPGSSGSTGTDYATYYRWTIRETSNGTGFRLSEFVLLDANGDRINGGTAKYAYDGLFTTDSAAATAIAALQPEHAIWTGGAMTFYADTSADPGVLFDGYTDSSHNRITAQNMTFDGTAANSRSLVFRVPEGSNPAATYYFNNGSQANSPTSWTLERSYDGVTWTTISEVSGAAAVADAYTKSPDYTITVPDTGASSGGGSGGSSLPAVLNVSGNPIVADNTVTGGSTLSNVQPTGDAQVHLAGSFGGNVGVNWPTEGEAEGAQFGVVTSGDSAEGFFYDGAPETYQGTIDGDKLVWETKSTEPVCRINDTTYTSLKLAVEAAQAGDTIVLLTNLTQRTNLAINKNVTIDGDGHTITRGGANGGFTVGGAVTMQNLTLDGDNVSANGPMVTVTNSGSLALPNAVTITDCMAGGVRASGPVSVAGTTTITGNEGGNLVPTAANLISVSGPLTGTIGVGYPTSVTDLAQFGTIGAYAVTGSDIHHFVCDNDTSYRATIKNGALRWTNQNSHYPDDGTIEQILNETEGEAITVIEIDTSTGDGSDIVIPAGRDVVIDLKGATLTMDVIANGNVTIIDSSADKTGKLIGELAENQGGKLTIEAGTYTQRPDEAWLAPDRIIVDNIDGTYTVVAIEGASTVTGCTLDTRRGVRLVENPYEDVLPLTYASSNWVFQASTNQNLKSYVAVADALPIVDGDFANAQWHDGMATNVAQGAAAAGDKSYDYPSRNVNIVEISPQLQLYLGPNESEVVWQEWRNGLVQAVITNETGYIRAWYKFPDVNSNIVPILPGDPTKVKDPDYPDPDDMNTPGDEDYPGYSITNDVSHPLIVVPDPLNPFSPDPNDPEHTITNYVAQTPTVGDPANTEMEMLIRVVGPGTLTWNDLIIDGSSEQDSWMSIRIDDGPSINVHTGGMEDWDSQKVVYGGDTDTVHTVRIKFKGNSSGDTVNQANGYIDNVVWDPYIPVVYEQVKDDESLPFIFENLGTEPTWENAGETHYYKNGSETYEIQSTVSTVDENGRQLTSQTTNEVSSTATGTEDYWYAIKDPGASNVVGNVIAQTAPTLGTNEVVVMHVTGIDGPSKFYWDMKIEEEGDPETPATLDVVITKTYTDPTTHETTVTVRTNTYTVAEISEWSHGYKPLGGEIGCAYDVDFIFTNNSDGSAVCKIDDIGWIRPDINIAPEMHDENDGKQPPNGSSYGADDKMRPDPNSPDNVNFKTDPYYPGYTLENESLNPWEVVPDPKTGSKASDPGKPNDDVAQSPDSLESGESTKIVVTVEGDGELKWKSFIDDGDGSSDVPATFIVIVDGKTNQVYASESEWTDHVVHVLDDGVDNATHVIEIIYVQETSDKPDSTGFVDNFRFEKSITNDEMQKTLVETDPPSHTVEEERTQVTCTNEVNSGWMPYYDENHTIVGVRSADGTEGTADGKTDPKDKEELDSTFYVHVIGTGEIKVDRISFPVEEDPFNTDDGTFTIKVDDTVYQYPPLSDDTPSYSIVTNNGIVTISNLVIKVSGDSDLPHDVTFNYHRDAYDITTNTEAIVQRITWKTYGEDDDGGSSWLEGKALWIIDHEDPGDGWVYLAFEPELKVVEELNTWVHRSDEHNMIKVKYGKTRALANACEPVVAHLSDKPGHEVTPVKVWIKVALTDIKDFENVGFWRIFIDGPAIHLTDADEADENVSEGPNPHLLGASDPLDPNSPAQESDIINTNGAISVNTFGILKIETRTTNTLVAVPWTWYSKLQKDAADIPIRKLVKPTNLTEGDIVYAYVDDWKYMAWVLDDGDWTPLKSVKVNDITEKFGGGEQTLTGDDMTKPLEQQASIPRGNGIWLLRQRPIGDNDKPIPFWIYGQSVTNAVVTEITPMSATNATKSVVGMSTIVGNPYAQPVSINDLVFEGDIEPGLEGDNIVIPNDTAYPLRLWYNASVGKWCYSTTIQKVFGKRTVLQAQTVYDYTVPAGLAFWYVRRANGTLKIKWPHTEVSK